MCFVIQSWVRIAAAGFLTVILAGCATVPETGRRQFNIISPGEEMKLGFSAFEEMKKEVPISRNSSLQAQVNRVGRRIAAVAELPGAAWEFVVFDDDQANAFCLPGGKVGIYTGILPITMDDAGLAAVMGHEVAHAVAHHGAERMSQALLIQAGAGALAYGIQDEDPTTAAALFAAYGIGSQVGVALPHSRLQESEADRIGLLYMARAGYDPGAAISFWQRFAEYNRQQGGQGLWFLRTHPLDEKRINQLKQWLPDAMREYKPDRVM